MCCCNNSRCISMLHVIDAEAVSIPLTWLGVGVVTAVIYTRCPSIVNCVQSLASPLVTTTSPMTIIVTAKLHNALFSLLDIANGILPHL